MKNYQNKSIIIFALSWTIFVGLLFLHTSSIITFPFFQFNQPRGALSMLEDSYNGNYNLVSLREKIFAIPHGVGFDHPNRKKLLKKNNVFVAYSHNEARKMVDKKTENIDGKFNLIKENHGIYNIFKSEDSYYIMPAVHPDSGMPYAIKNLPPYKEFNVGKTYDEALVNIEKFEESIK
jgi:hypothetical protein